MHVLQLFICLLAHSNNSKAYIRIALYYYYIIILDIGLLYILYIY